MHRLYRDLVDAVDACELISSHLIFDVMACRQAFGVVVPKRFADRNISHQLAVPRTGRQ